MKNVIIVIISLLVLVSCKSSQHGCDAYGFKENFSKVKHV
jgi:hypothetical protein